MCVWGTTHILQCSKYGEMIVTNAERSGIWKWLRDATQAQVEAVVERIKFAMKHRWKSKKRVTNEGNSGEERPGKRLKVVQFPPAMVYIAGNRPEEEQPRSAKAVIHKQSTRALIEKLQQQKRQRDEAREANERKKKRKKDGFLEGTLEVLEERVQAMGRRTQWVAGDGNCMFRALCMSRYGSDEGHLQLRERIAPRIEAYRTELGDENVFDAGREIAQPRVYGW
jgi:hypothetical protein